MLFFRFGGMIYVSLQFIPWSSMTSPQLLWLPFSHTSRYSNTPGVSGSPLQVLKSTVHLHGQFITSAIQFENLEFNRLFSTEDSLSTRVAWIYPKKTQDAITKFGHFQPKPSFVTGILGGDSKSQYTYLGSAQKRWFFLLWNMQCPWCHFMQVQLLKSRYVKNFGNDIRDMFRDKVLVSRCLLQEVLKDIYEIRQFRATSK